MQTSALSLSASWIFEALTTPKQAGQDPPTPRMTLIKVMRCMPNDGHICPDRFELSLKSGGLPRLCGKAYAVRAERRGDIAAPMEYS
ncbi:MAG: hypothetical protein KJ804_14170 [Proteobacteria bacterium]|nr:hypothetical protein [Pseudomonadota bacterium]MBU1059455.1 hypothetical protein [Pseudomonadota bacterium]